MSESFVTYKGFAHYYGMKSLVIKKLIFITFLISEGHLFRFCLILHYLFLKKSINFNIIF